MGAVTDALEGKIRIQNKLEKLEKNLKWIKRNLNNDKYKAPHIREKSHQHKYRLWNDQFRLQYWREGFKDYRGPWAVNGIFGAKKLVSY